MNAVLSSPNPSVDALIPPNMCIIKTAKNQIIESQICNCSVNYNICMSRGKNSKGSKMKCVVCGENCGRPTLLDLFSGAGGAAYGYRKAGFCVLGIDVKFQPHYAGCKFHQADAFDYLREHGTEFDVIHASPPCQAFSDLKSCWNSRKHKDSLTPIREILKSINVPWIIENVVGAPMFDALTLCGTMFNLGVGDAELWRHRIFESSIFIAKPRPCSHRSKARCIGIYGGHGRDRRRVMGHSGERSVRDGTQDFSVADRKIAMGIDWMSGEELSQAVPPAYTEWIGKQLMKILLT
jgi:DNA (cytosine-5)-methyltransferase 1